MKSILYYNFVIYMLFCILPRYWLFCRDKFEPIILTPPLTQVTTIATCRFTLLHSQKLFLLGNLITTVISYRWNHSLVHLCLAVSLSIKNSRLNRVVAGVRISFLGWQVEGLPSLCEVLGLNPSTAKTEKNKERKWKWKTFLPFQGQIISHWINILCFAYQSLSHVNIRGCFYLLTIGQCCYQHRWRYTHFYLRAKTLNSIHSFKLIFHLKWLTNSFNT